MANPNLVAEKSFTYDVGIDHNFGDGLTSALTFYAGQLTDPITYTMVSPGISQAQNLGASDTKGAEVELKKQFSPEWSSYINYTYNESRVTSNPNNTALVGKLMSYSPLNKAGIGITYDIPKVFTGTLQGHFVDNQFQDSANTTILGGYFVTDCKFTWHLNAANLTLGVNNIGDVQYTRFWKGWLELPRVFYVQADYTF
jgi:outer membrane receptor protein involved in Fe transport